MKLCIASSNAHDTNVYRMTRLAMSNSKLRDELDKSREMGNRLTESVRKLSEDLSATQKELNEREKSLKDNFLVWQTIAFLTT